MRICLITSSYARFEDDGNARFVRSIAEAQVTLGHEVHVLAPYTPQVQPYTSPVHVHWFKYIRPTRLGVMGHAAALENDRSLRGAALWQAPLFAASLLFHLQRLILRYQFDILHAHWILPAGALVSWIARLNRKPFFISLHGSDVYLAQRNKVWRSLAHAAFQHGSGVTACSEPLAEAAWRLGAPPDRVHIIPWGADPGRFDPSLDAQAYRQRLGLPADGNLILAVGRLVAKKGFVQLVQSMPRILEQVPVARLVILGEGPERQHLERWREDLDLTDRVLLPGAVPWNIMPVYLAACDVFVMPSVKDPAGNLDGLPTVILEAMAAGKPVVATRVAGMPLAIRDHETGVLVENADPDQLSAAITRVLSSPADGRAMGRAARRRVEAELNWLEVARRFDRMYGVTTTNPAREMI